MFDVDDYENYVATQSETALRHLAGNYAYDHGEETEGDAEITLRSNMEEVSVALRQELQDRLAKAGVNVEEARLTHLAYSPEIAQAMLRPAAGGSGDSCPAEDRARRGEHGGYGAARVVRARGGGTGRRTQGSHGQQPHGGTVRESEVHPVVNTGTLYA